MIRRFLSASMVMASAVSVALTPAANASPLHVKSPVAAMFGSPSKEKPVSLSLRNDTAAAITLTAGTQSLTIQPGKTQAAKLNVGDKVVGADGTTVYAVVSRAMADATIVIK